MLNTWRGEQWTSCQTISSILLTICCTVFTEEPLLNEPGVQRKHKDFKAYQKIIEYANIDIAIINIITRNEGIYISMFDHFREDVFAHFQKRAPNLHERVSKLAKKSPDTTHYTTSLYNMSVRINYHISF